MSKWHIFLFLFLYRVAHVMGQFVKWNSEISFLPKVNTHTDTLTPKSTPHRTTDQFVEKEAGWTWSWESNGAEGSGELKTPLEALTACDRTALWLKRPRRKGHGRSVTVATHAGLQSHKQRYEGIWGVLVSLRMEIHNKRWESISWKHNILEV